MKISVCPWCNSPLPDPMSPQVCTTCGKILHSAASAMSGPSETSELDSNFTPNYSHLGIQSYLRKILFALSYSTHFFRLRKGIPFKYRFFCMPPKGTGREERSSPKPPETPPEARPLDPASKKTLPENPSRKGFLVYLKYIFYSLAKGVRSLFRSAKRVFQVKWKALLLRSRLWSNHRLQKRDTRRFAERKAFSIPLTLEDEMQFTGPLPDQASEDNDLSQLRPDGQLTWQKVVELSPRRQSYTYPPRPPVPEDEHKIPLLPEHLSQTSSKLLALKRSTASRLKRTSPKVVFWISTVILLLTVGFFGVAIGHGQSTDLDNRLSLHITPGELSVGATMLLSGDHFSQRASVGFTRDNGIPLIDTSDALSTQADKAGHFTDTVIVGPDWKAGPHMITAEDSITHKMTSFPVMVDGQGASLPPHLHLSVNSLDFGSGDQATNGTKTLTLFNSGSNEITWQASTSESWLLITPTQGTFTRDAPQQVTVAVDRSKLQPGSYTAQVNFSSDGGDASLPVAAQVTPLNPGHTPIMQVSPALLSFTATDGSSTTPSQPITVSNPGGQAMNWSALANVPWLTVSPSSMAVAAGGVSTTNVSVASRNLLPGTYTGTLTFTGQNSQGNDSVLHSPQQVVVSITIMPACALRATSGMVDFSSVYLQPAPPPKTIGLTASPGCTAPLNWDATSNAGWLSINSTRGRTPSTLSIGVRSAGLAPDTYRGNITLSSSAGTQTVVITLVVGSADPGSTSAGPVCSLQAPSTTGLNFSTTTGVNPARQSFSIGVSGACGGGVTLTPTLTGGNWLSISPSSAVAPATFTVSVNATALAANQYAGSITLTGTLNGSAIEGSPQTIAVTFAVAAAPPVLVATPSSINIDASGTASLPVNLANTGGSPLNWSANLQNGAPAFVSLSATSGTDLAGGANASFNVVVNTNGANSGKYRTSVTITATSAANGQPVSGSPVTIPITITVTSS